MLLAGLSVAPANVSMPPAPDRMGQPIYAILTFATATEAATAAHDLRGRQLPDTGGSGTGRGGCLRVDRWLLAKIPMVGLSIEEGRGAQAAAQVSAASTGGRHRAPTGHQRLPPAHTGCLSAGPARARRTRPAGPAPQRGQRGGGGQPGGGGASKQAQEGVPARPTMRPPRKSARPQKARPVRGGSPACPPPPPPPLRLHRSKRTMGRERRSKSKRGTSDQQWPMFIFQPGPPRGAASTRGGRNSSPAASQSAAAHRPHRPHRPHLLRSPRRFAFRRQARPSVHALLREFHRRRSGGGGGPRQVRPDANRPRGGEMWLAGDCLRGWRHGRDDGAA